MNNNRKLTKNIFKLRFNLSNMVRYRNYRHSKICNPKRKIGLKITRWSKRIKKMMPHFTIFTPTTNFANNNNSDFCLHDFLNTFKCVSLNIVNFSTFSDVQLLYLYMKLLPPIQTSMAVILHYTSNENWDLRFKLPRKHAL